MKAKKKILIALLIILLIIAAIISGALLWIKLNYVGKVQDKEFNPKNLAVNMVPFENHKVTNIALLGLDIKRDFGDRNGRSDAIIILTIDRENNKLKLSSIARDSYVKIEKTPGYAFNDKITHAHSYGGAELAVKTINQNFNMDITDYVSVNYMQFAKIIDYIGGVEIDVDESEMRVANNYIHSLRSTGVPCEDIKETGKQVLSGAQALAYARNRYSPGGDIARGNRQKEVLMAAYERVKKMNKFLDYEKIIKMLCENCKTSLNDYEIFDIGLWTAKNLPSIESFSLPTADCKPKSGNDAMINGTWYYIYDLEKATENLHAFIKGE